MARASMCAWALPSLLLLQLLALSAFGSAVPQPDASLAGLLEEARAPGVRDFMLTMRQHLHQWPELQFEVHNTSAYVRRVLDDLGISYEYPFATAGIAAVIGAGDGPTIALRSDMDALPIAEAADCPQPHSQVAGCMHACGHDAHMAMLLGAAKLLKDREATLPGRVVLLFQPAEEGGGGARFMIDEGALRGAQAVAGMHVWPSLPAGVIATRPGTIMAASDRFVITVHGRGGHGALPHLAVDPVVAAAAIVMALQSIVSRETSPTDGAVVTVSRFNTGPGAANVIPDSVELMGTIRALTQATFDRLHTRVEEVAAGAAAVYGCRVDSVEWAKVPYPPTVNDAAMVDLVARVAGDAFELLEEPSMAAEDFSFYGREVPSVMTFLGIGSEELGTDTPLHHPAFRMHDEQMLLGAALHAATALAFLAANAPPDLVHKTEL